MYRFIGVFIGLFLLMSCGKDEVIFTESPRFSTGIDLTISPWQTLPSDAGVFTLAVSNEVPLECSNNVIDLNYAIDNEDISLVSGGVPAQSDCITAPTTLVYSYDLPKEIGEYTITIDNNGFTNIGKLSILEKQLLMKFESEDGLVITSYQQNKIPEDIIWGYTSLSTTEGTDIASTFKGPVLGTALDHVSELRLDGDFGYFVADDYRHLSRLGDVTDFGQSMILSMQEEGAWDKLGVILSNEVSMFPNVKYEFYNAEGQSYVKI